ncbi:MAG: 3-deoxy-manno-octulosonate cytidylyltransferase [Planctomycetes bacterium]|jgi:3-deoxy-manno-octulosonate cytidylyltransferase (CMP-KDO synthetase)|nr:3-deoxy-manno-octulosonate cytidylyltransferase [Planctomycetota bacterium]
MSSSRAIVIIPARYASTRLPGKPLLNETGKPLIQHVVEAVRPAQRVDRIVVATDDDRIAQAVRDFGGDEIMTSRHCASGTDRLAEAAERLELDEEDIVINVQGDEPDIPAPLVDSLIDLLEESGAPMATLCTPLPAEDADDPNNVKVVFSDDRHALYFSRARIPHDRDETGHVAYYLHLGIYAYRVAFLKTFASLPPTPAEQAEGLEQLRALQRGHTIAIQAVDYDGSGIDTAADYAVFVARTKGRR